MLVLSPNAAREIARLKKDTIESGASNSNSTSAFLRIRVVKGGCSGLSYKLDFDQNIQATDQVYEDHGEKIVIDQESLLYVLGMTLDYEGGLNGKGFIFSNPNATKTCGCGTSFKV